ncbi:hypothetical protein GGS21DRAFT_371164 [Xylaria nigripes]|nr:hypothetical protein GGS21DRAFT_371164 [Xylaria nigripes]
MNQLQNSEQLVIENLRAQLRSKDEDLEEAKRQIFHLQTSVHQQQLSQPGETFSDTQMADMLATHNPSTAEESISIPHNTGGKSQARYHADPQSSHGYQDGDGLIFHAVKRPRTMSQQALSSEKMDRVASNLSSRSAGPFTRSTPISPFSTFHTAGLQTELSHDSYLSNGSYMATQNFAGPMQRIAEDNPQRLSTTAGAGPLSLTTNPLVDPATWLAAHEDPSSDFGVFSPFSSASQQSDTAASNLNMGASACDSMTSGTSYDNTAPMTRQNSRFDDNSAPRGVPMVGMGSQMSQDRDAYFSESSQHNVDYYDASLVVKPRPCEDLFAIGSNLSSFAGHHYAVTTPDDGLLSSPGMERSLSSTSAASAKSTSSLNARAKDTLKQQNHRALNAPLKPKPTVDESRIDAPSDEKNDGKAVIAKTKYVRPRQPKVFCDLCDEHKEGFRGEHELRRHKDAKHQTLVKKFICVDPNALGIPANVQVINPLSKCKACKAQKKYGAYYNAAAHLRRTHFKEKPSRSKSKNPSASGGEDDKRGGKGGGDWPSMHELKNWMREVLVQQDEQQPKEEDDADDDIDNIQPFFSDTEMDSNPAGNSPQSLASIGMANIDYRFSNLLTTNSINTGMAYINPIPLSSADFSFNGSPNVSLAFNTDVAACSAMDHMISSPSMVTPQIVFSDAQHQHFDSMNYQYAT